MKQYLEVVEKIITEGREKESGRKNMPNTIGISNSKISMNMKDGFPLLTTKKMYWKGIVHELLWFLRGDTNIKYLVDNKVNIWNDDALRWYKQKYVSIGFPDMEMDEFIDNVKNNISKNVNGVDYLYGNLDKVYGYQWRNQNGVDQVQNVIDGLKNNPYSRYHIIDGWNKADFSDMALPPCHLLYQFIVRPLTHHERITLKEKLYPIDTTDLDTIEKLDKYNIPKFYLDLNMYQRSVDTALGAGFNLASMSTLLLLFAKATNMVAGVANWIGGDTHIYVNHIENIKEQLTRKPYDLPEMRINKDLNSLDDIVNLTIDDFELVGYKSHPTIKFDLYTGL